MLASGTGAVCGTCLVAQSSCPGATRYPRSCTSTCTHAVGRVTRRPPAEPKRWAGRGRSGHRLQQAKRTGSPSALHEMPLAERERAAIRSRCPSSTKCRASSRTGESCNPRFRALLPRGCKDCSRPRNGNNGTHLCIASVLRAAFDANCLAFVVRPPVHAPGARARGRKLALWSGTPICSACSCRVAIKPANLPLNAAQACGGYGRNRPCGRWIDPCKNS